LSKTDIFKRTMVYDLEGSTKPIIISLDKMGPLREQVKRGEMPDNLDGFKIYEEVQVVEKFADVTGQVTLKNLEKAGQKKKQSRNRNSDRNKTDKNADKRTGSRNNPKAEGGNKNRNRNRPNRNRGKGPNKES
jgi:hypothetical protein